MGILPPAQLHLLGKVVVLLRHLPVCHTSWHSTHAAIRLCTPCLAGSGVLSVHWEATLKVCALLCSPITEPSSYRLHIERQPPQGLFFIENAFYQLIQGLLAVFHHCSLWEQSRRYLVPLLHSLHTGTPPLPSQGGWWDFRVADLPSYRSHCGSSSAGC